MPHSKTPYKSNLARKPFCGTIDVPGDKSLSHRAIIFASLAEGQTQISGLLESEDVLNTVQAFRQMGVSIDKRKDFWIVDGVGLRGLKEPQDTLDMGNSGTAARLLAGVLAGQDFNSTLTGDASLTNRPMKRVITPLSKMGASVEARADQFLPLAISGMATELEGITYESPVASAQIKSCILLASLYADSKTTVIELHLSRDHTERLSKAFGWHIDKHIEEDGRAIISSEAGQKLIAPQSILELPSDPSSAAFPVAVALLVEGSDIIIQNVNINPTRIGFFETLKDMGARLSFENLRECGGEPVADIHAKYSRDVLKGIDVRPARVTAMIDEFPIFCVVAACAGGTSTAEGLSELRVKECDRLSAMAEGLTLCGVDVDEGDASISITGQGVHKNDALKDIVIPTYYDHRIAMSFLIYGALFQDGLMIDDISAVATSFPNFVELMNGLGLELNPA